MSGHLKGATCALVAAMAGRKNIVDEQSARTAVNEIERCFGPHEQVRAVAADTAAAQVAGHRLTDIGRQRKLGQDVALPADPQHPLAPVDVGQRDAGHFRSA